MLLTLTGAGRRAVDQMRQRLAGVLDEYLARWPPGQAEQFAASLRRFIDESPF